MGRVNLLPKLAKIYGEITAKHGTMFSNDTLGKWDFWTYDQDMPKEVINAADKLNSTYDKIEYFSTTDDPDAFDDFARAIQKTNLKYEFGTFRTRRNRPINFAVVVNE